MRQSTPKLSRLLQTAGDLGAGALLGLIAGVPLGFAAAFALALGGLTFIACVYAAGFFGMITGAIVMLWRVVSFPAIGPSFCMLSVPIALLGVVTRLNPSGEAFTAALFASVTVGIIVAAQVAGHHRHSGPR